MAEPLVLGPGEGQKIDNPIGGRFIFKLRGEHSDGSLAAVETIVPPGEGPPYHLHPAADETLFVLEGEFRFKVNGRLHAGPAGTSVFVPRGTEHTFQCIGDGPGRMLVHFTPAGIERFFDAFDALENGGPEDFARLGAESGTDVTGPPLAQSDPV